MPVVLIPIFVIVAIVVLVAIAFGVRTWGKGHVEAQDELAGPAETLDYEVPQGQDPAVLIAALQEDGYHAAADPQQTNLLHIDCPTGVNRERPRVRATLESVHSTAMDSGVPTDPPPVRFADER